VKSAFQITQIMTRLVFVAILFTVSPTFGQSNAVIQDEIDAQRYQDALDATIRAEQIQEQQFLLERQRLQQEAARRRDEETRPQREAWAAYEAEQAKILSARSRYAREHPSPQLQAQLEAQARLEAKQQRGEMSSTPTPARSPSPTPAASSLPSPVVESKVNQSLGSPSPNSSPK
jgi:hypothetical protein